MMPPGIGGGCRGVQPAAHAPSRARRAVLCRLTGALAAVAPVLLGACAGPPRSEFHLLHDADPSPRPAATRSDQVLLIAGANPGALYDTERMVFSADGTSRSFFQFGFWADRPQRRLLQLAEQRLVRAQAFRDVALSTSGVRGGLLLTLRLDALYLDDASEPAQARLAFDAELVDWRARRLVARRRFAAAAGTPEHDAAAFAAAASTALGTLLGELVDWLAVAAA